MYEDIYNDDRFDEEVGLSEVLESYPPVDPDTVDAKLEKPPPLPAKRGAGNKFTGHPAGSVLMNLKCGRSGQEISQLDMQEFDSSRSASVKAFFEDIVDSSCIVPPTFSYNMEHESRGFFLIFNHMKFEDHLNLPSRAGTHKDKENLKQTAYNLGFKNIVDHDDLNYAQIQKAVSKIVMDDHTRCDCFVMAILTHGDKDDLLYAHDASYHMDDLMKSFTTQNCPSLAGKPKLFFVQACRGKELDAGAEVKVEQIAVESKKNTIQACHGEEFDIGAKVEVQQIAKKSKKDTILIRNGSDFLIAFCTAPGYFAWRNTVKGSWFIQALCKCLNEFGDKLELMHIMTRVNRMVAYDYESSSDAKKYDKKKQIPSIVTSLSSEVYFRKKTSPIQVQSQKSLGLKAGLPSENRESPSHVSKLRETTL